MVASMFIAAMSVAAIPLLTTRTPHAQASASRAWPHNEGRLFDLTSRQAWDRVQDRLKPLGLGTDKKDGKNQLLLTDWGDFGSSRLRWLPRPKMGQEFAPERVRFEVFVSPFVEPARVYVGSVTRVRQAAGRGAHAILYNDRTLNSALLAELAKALGQEGFAIPSSHEERQKLAASTVKRRADECTLKAEACNPLERGREAADARAQAVRGRLPGVGSEREGRSAGRRSARRERGRHRGRRAGPGHSAGPLLAGRLRRRHVPPRLLASQAVRLSRPAHDGLHDRLSAPIGSEWPQALRREILSG